MTEKAMVSLLTGLAKQSSGDYLVGISAKVTYGTGFVTINTSATSSNFTPLLPPWRTRIRDAVVAQALAEYGLTVDAVLSPDFGVLGI